MAERPNELLRTAKAPDGKGHPPMGNVMWWSVVLIGLLLAAFVAVAQVKKRLVRSDDTSGGGFTLSDLRQLHRAGKMTDEEFEKAKQVIVTAAQRAAERQTAQAQAEKKQSSGGGGTDPRLR